MVNIVLCLASKGYLVDKVFRWYIKIEKSQHGIKDSFRKIKEDNLNKQQYESSSLNVRENEIIGELEAEDI